AGRRRQERPARVENPATETDCEVAKNLVESGKLRSLGEGQFDGAPTDAYDWRRMLGSQVIAKRSDWQGCGRLQSDLKFLPDEIPQFRQAVGFNDFAYADRCHASSITVHPGPPQRSAAAHGPYNPAPWFGGCPDQPPSTLRTP